MVMKKRIGRKFLYSLVTLTSIIQASGAYAKIPPIAFKGVTKHFKKGQAFFSLTLGDANKELRLNIGRSGITTRAGIKGIDLDKSKIQWW